MPATVKLMIAFRDGIVVCTEDNELWYGEPGRFGTAAWTWMRI